MSLNFPYFFQVLNISNRNQNNSYTRITTETNKQRKRANFTQKKYFSENDHEFSVKSK